MAMFDFLGGEQFTGGGLRMTPQQQYVDGIGFKPPMAFMAQGDGLPMASMPQNFGQMPIVLQMPNNFQNATLSMRLLDAGRENAAPMMKSAIPMGRASSYQDIMKMYGIQGLMG